MLEIRGEKAPAHRRSPAFGGRYSPYLGTVAGARFVDCRTQPSPMMIAPPLNGGPVFAGKSGRNTANACEANAMKTIMVAAAHFMLGALIRIRQHDK
jgi:hypothetical protein